MGSIGYDVQTGPWLDCRQVELSISCQARNLYIIIYIGQTCYGIGKGVHVDGDGTAAIVYDERAGGLSTGNITSFSAGIRSDQKCLLTDRLVVVY